MNNKQLQQTITRIVDEKLGNVSVSTPSLPDSQEGQFEYSPVLPLLSDNSVKYTVSGTVKAVKGVFFKLTDSMGFKNNEILYEFTGNITVCTELQEGKTTISAYIDEKYPLQAVSPLNNRVINLKQDQWAFKFEYFLEKEPE